MLKHVALHNEDREKAKTFFTKIFGLSFKKTFNLNKQLTNKIFGINEDVTVDVYANEKIYLEIFITDLKTNHGFQHVCIKVENKKEFIKQCKKYDIKPILIKKGEKTLLFIRDYSGNLFEIIE